MKRLLLILAFAVACLALLAAPAFASAPWAPAFRLAPQTAYIFAYGDGSWFEVCGADLVAEPHWALYDEYGVLVAPADPIPADYDVVMQLSWKGYNYGLVKKLPTALEVRLSIPEADVDLSYEQAKAYWTGPFIWDLYWVENAGPIPAFNPRIGANVYANRWLLPLTGDKGLATNLVDGRLPAGTYTVSYAERFVKTYTGLEQWLWDDEGNPLGTKPWHAKPGDESTVEFTFTVE